jgi:hypothetical protein
MQISYNLYLLICKSKQKVFYMNFYQKNVKNLNITCICLFASRIMSSRGSVHIT